MPRFNPALLMLALAAMLPSAPAQADSDGYFCAGPGYIAVEFRAFNTPGLEAPHVLKLAVFGGERGPRWAGEVEMSDFQPTWMRCDADGVVIAGWGDQVWVRYVVGADDSGELTVLERDENSDKAFGVPDAVLQNLGRWGVPGVYPLPSSDPKFRYELRINVTERSGESVIWRDHRSVLVQLDREGRERERLVLYEATSEEPVH